MRTGIKVKLRKVPIKKIIKAKSKVSKGLTKGHRKKPTIIAQRTKRDYQYKICLWLALYKTTRQIIDLLKDKCDVKMSRQGIDKVYRYGKKWRKIVIYIRKRFLNSISRIPIANKTYRLSLLQEAAEEALTWRIKTINQFGVVMEKKIGTIPAIAREVREEMGWKDPNTKEQVVEKHTHFTDIHIVAEGKSRRELIDLILGRGNARNLAGTRK